MLRRRIILISLLGLATAVALTLAGCRRPAAPSTNNQATNNAANTADNTANTAQNTIASSSGLPDALSIMTMLKSETQQASSQISVLKSGLELVIVSMTFDKTFSDMNGLVTNYYIFSSPSDQSYYYIVNMPRDGSTPKRFLMLKSDFNLGFAVIPIPLSDWKINYAQAIQAAEQQGGATFRSQHPDFRATVTLAMPATQKLAWYITYRASDQSGATFKATVDASSGAVAVVQ